MRWHTPYSNRVPDHITSEAIGYPRASSIRVTLPDAARYVCLPSVEFLVCLAIAPAYCACVICYYRNLVQALDSHWALNYTVPSIQNPNRVRAWDAKTYTVNPYAVGQQSTMLQQGTFYPISFDDYVSTQQSSEEGFGIPVVEMRAVASSDLSTLTLDPTNPRSCYGTTVLYRRLKDELAASAALVAA